MKCPFVMSCPLDKGTLGQYYFPLSEVDTIVSHYATSYHENNVIVMGTHI